MRKRTDDHHEITRQYEIVAIRPKHWSRRCFECLFWLVTHAPGSLMIWYGAHLQDVKQIRLPRSSHVLTGDRAIAASWVMIGIGIWLLGSCGAFFENRPLLKWLAYIAAGGIFIYGLAHSFK